MQLSTLRDPELATMGRRIKAARIAAGLAQGAAAREIGISRTALGQWEADSVKNPDVDKLLAFTRLADVELGWLVDRRGEDPDLTPRDGPRSIAPSPRWGMAYRSAPPPSQPVAESTEVPEISPSLAAHAKSINLTPRAVWSMPGEVLEIGFQATLGRMVIQRVVTRDDSDTGLSRGDYVLIDASRNRIDEPGVYLLADPEGQSARRALVTLEAGTLKAVILRDVLGRPNKIVAETDTLDVLGRVMGKFQPM